MSLSDMSRRLTIAGSAGRNSDKRFMTRDNYGRMVAMATSYVYDNGLRYVSSGGAAFGDHVAVSLVMRGLIPPSHLILYLPERFNTGTCQFNPSSVGRTTNIYHKAFSEKMGVDTLAELKWCIQNGAKPICGSGNFQERNTKMALFPGKEGRLLAFTSGQPGDNTIPFTLLEFGPNVLAANAGLKLSRGTADTWDKSFCPKAHIRLGIAQ